MNLSVHTAYKTVEIYCAAGRHAVSLADYIYEDNDPEEQEEKAQQEDKARPQTPEEMISAIKLWNSALGGEVINEWTNEFTSKRSFE